MYVWQHILATRLDIIFAANTWLYHKRSSYLSNKLNVSFIYTKDQSINSNINASAIGNKRWERTVVKYLFTIPDMTNLNLYLNTLWPRQNCLHSADIFKCNFVNGNAYIKTSLKFIPEVRINNIPALVPIMAWRRRGDKPFFLTNDC